MNHRTSMMAAVAAAGLFAAPCHAEIRSGQQFLTLGLGAGMPLSDVDTTALGGGKRPLGSPGFSGSAQYIYHARPSLGWGLEAAYSRFGEMDHNVVFGVLTTGASVLTVQGLLRYVFLPESKASPYLLAGAGANRFSAHLKARPTPPFVWANTSTNETRTFTDASSTGFAFSLGIGVEGSSRQDWVFGAEMRWLYARVDKDKFGESSGRTLGLYGRVGRKFGS